MKCEFRQNFKRIKIDIFIKRKYSEEKIIIRNYEKNIRCFFLEVFFRGILFKKRLFAIFYQKCKFSIYNIKMNITEDLSFEKKIIITFYFIQFFFRGILFKKIQCRERLYRNKQAQIPGVISYEIKKPRRIRKCSTDFFSFSSFFF